MKDFMKVFPLYFLMFNLSKIIVVTGTSITGWHVLAVCFAVQITGGLFMSLCEHITGEWDGF